MWNKFYFYRYDHQYGIFLLYESGYHLVTNRIKIFSKPGLALQKLTTKEPDHSMIEVAIASVEGVFDWREYLDSLNKGEQKEDE